MSIRKRKPREIFNDMSNEQLIEYGRQNDLFILGLTELKRRAPSFFINLCKRGLLNMIATNDKKEDLEFPDIFLAEKSYESKLIAEIMKYLGLKNDKKIIYKNQFEGDQEVALGPHVVIDRYFNSEHVSTIELKPETVKFGMRGYKNIVVLGDKKGETITLFKNRVEYGIGD